MDDKSIQHARWNCTYHIVFILKYRRKIMYGANKKDMVEIIPKLCEMKGVSLIEGKVCKDHVHMYVAIPPKLSVSDFMSYLKGKSALMFFDRHPELRPKYADRHFWAIAEGHSPKEIAEMMGVSVATYYRRLAAWTAQGSNDKGGA